MADHSGHWPRLYTQAYIYIDTEILIPRDVCVFDFLIGVVPAI